MQGVVSRRACTLTVHARPRARTALVHNELLIGTASWSDPEFVRDWYPAGLPAGERLGWYARHLRFVEVNSTFYGLPSARLTERWAAQTPADFVFDVKLHQLLSRHRTRPEMLGAKLRGLAEQRSGAVVLTPELEAAAVEDFLAALEPLRSAGKLGTLLLQLSPSFALPRYRLEELDGLLGLLSGESLAIELRNRGWMEGDQREETLAWFREHGIAMVLLDVPPGEHRTLMPPDDTLTNPDLAYLRLHGRDAHAFLTGKTVADRFRYDYSRSELEEVKARVTGLALAAKKVHLVFNNNSSDYAPRAAITLQEMFGQPQPTVGTPEGWLF